MKTKIKILSVILVIVLIANPLLTWEQTTVLAAENTFTIDDETLYNCLKTCFESNMNKDALVNSNDETKTITLDMDKVGMIDIKNVDMTNNNSKNLLESLFRECTNLQSIYLTSCKLDGIDFSELENRNNLTVWYLVSCDLSSVPDLNLSKLETLCMSQNDLSAAGACDNLNKNNYPVLTTLWLDECNIPNIDFIENMGELTDLSLGENKLKDDSLDVLIAASSDNLSGLKALNLGVTVHVAPSIAINSNESSSNEITEVAKLASLPTYFGQLGSLNISGLQITSLKDFEGLSDDIVVNFTRNSITDFAGLENKGKFNLNNQNIILSGNFAAGIKSELPELVRRILDTEDVLSGALNYENCSLSDDGTEIVIEPNIRTAYVEVTKGKLYGTQIDFSLKSVPGYTIPQNLKASEGDTLADIILPNGFTWQDDTLSVGTKGINTFKAVYTPEDTDAYVIVYDINIPITVEGEEPEKPTEPETDPADPTEPETDPADPTEPETDPADPTEPVTDPTDPTEPITDPADPTEPVTDDPTDPIKPETKPTGPTTDPTKPVQDPTEPKEPVTSSTELAGDEHPTVGTTDNYDNDMDKKDKTEAVETSDTSPILPITVLLLVSGIIYMTVSEKRKTV